MVFIDETTLTGIVRAEVSYARDNGNPVAEDVAYALAIADLLQFPMSCRCVRACARLHQPPLVWMIRKVWLTPGPWRSLPDAVLLAALALPNTTKGRLRPPLFCCSRHRRRRGAHAAVALSQLAHLPLVFDLVHTEQFGHAGEAAAFTHQADQPTVRATRAFLERDRRRQWPT